MNYEGKKQFLINFFYYGILLVVAVRAAKFGWEYLTPFVIAFIVAFLLKPIVNRVNVYLKIKRNIAAILVVLGFYAAVLGVVSFIGIELFVLLQNLLLKVPDMYTYHWLPAIEKFLNRLRIIIRNIDPTITRVVEEYSMQILAKAGEMASTVSVAALGVLSGIATGIPGLFIGTLITIIASVFISVDYYEITFFIAKQLTTRQATLLYETETYAKNAIVQYLKSYFLILFITFMELGIGLWILGVKLPFLIAGIIAIFDILPIRGTGGILVPWAVYSVVTGQVVFGIGIFVLYVTITVIRNVLEPKIVGQQVGLHPVATFIAMFLGLKLLGIVGLFGFPVALVIIRQLNESGKIKLFK